MPWTETCSWFYTFLSLPLRTAAAVVAVVVATLSILVDVSASLAPLSGRHVRPEPAVDQRAGDG